MTHIILKKATFPTRFRDGSSEFYSSFFASSSRTKSKLFPRKYHPSSVHRRVLFICNHPNQSNKNNATFCLNKRANIYIIDVANHKWMKFIFQQSDWCEWWLCTWNFAILLLILRYPHQYPPSRAVAHIINFLSEIHLIHQNKWSKSWRYKSR